MSDQLRLSFNCPVFTVVHIRDCFKNRILYVTFVSQRSLFSNNIKKKKEVVGQEEKNQKNWFDERKIII